MTHNLTAPTAKQFQLGLPARASLIAAVIFGEKLLLNAFVDADRAQAAQGFGAAFRIAQHWGFRFLVAFVAAIALFAYFRGGQQLKVSDAAMRSASMRVRWMLVHVLFLACLVPLSYLSYRETVTGLTATVLSSFTVNT